MKAKKAVILFFAGLFLYFGLYTWNLRTGHLDQFCTYVGLDVAVAVFRPVDWGVDQVHALWRRYISLVDLRQENDDLAAENRRLKLANLHLLDRSRAVERLERLLAFPPPEDWTLSGARVAAQRLGPAATLQSLVVDKGALDSVARDMPVLTPDGVVGRVLETGLAAAQVMLLTDPNAAVAVIGQRDRSVGIVTGQGASQPLTVNYVKVNSPLGEGELLLTSGLAGIYPKGLPVARVTRIERSEISLFLTVEAEPLVDPSGLEEVLLLHRVARSAPAPDPGAGETVPAPGPDADGG